MSRESSPRSRRFEDFFEVLGLVGKGSFGHVLKVRRRSDGKVLVCKVLSYRDMTEKEKQLIVSEVNILRELSHPNIVKYEERFLNKREAKLYIVMEYCEGGDLGRHIRRLKRERTFFEENRIWKMLAQLLLAFEECHFRKEIILHRDIKPCNIFLDKAGNVKVGDFGLAKELAAQSRFAYTNLGTPYYMSPELINEKRYNEKSDIWALGCLTFEMCSRSPPFEASNVVSLSRKISSGVFPRIPRHYSDLLQELVSAMLTVDPIQRPSVREIMHKASMSLFVARAKAKVSKPPILNESPPLESEETDRFRVIEKREKELKKWESRLREKEEELEKREKKILNREREAAKRATSSLTPPQRVKNYQTRTSETSQMRSRPAVRKQKPVDLFRMKPRRRTSPLQTPS